ncbi:S1 family peptidase [Staphylococcus carnosus]|uniref:S1 family peptidase n=2 Tax=Staphylococcus carnosus TaxID=1281 RepID=UPI000DF87A6E|nr:serine protease [Staphylococcus carnosus]QRQ05747.1 trypsin-like peptidase domain-containing protein [Staphylococcus carnosus]SUM07569.1 peptidase Do [Staphylococcus carnosus]
MDYMSFLSKVVVKITTDKNSSGTGFFYEFIYSKDTTIPVILTNKHVIEESSSIRITLSKNEYFSSENKIVEKEDFLLKDLQNRIVNHPNSDIDLCAIIIADMLKKFQDESVKMDIAFLNDKNLPNINDLEDLKFAEEVIMIGYPNGISDTFNNFPVFRKGITATHPAINFDGTPHFLIDMTIVPGSSGSPVFLYNATGYSTKSSEFIFNGERLMFLGINKAVFIADNFGEIKEVQEPTKLISHSTIGINLGIIINSLEINEIKKEFNKLLENSEMNGNEN